MFEWTPIVLLHALMGVNASVFLFPMNTVHWMHRLTGAQRSLYIITTMANQEKPAVEVAEEEKNAGAFITPDGRVITEEEADDNKRRAEDDPNWLREQE